MYAFFFLSNTFISNGMVKIKQMFSKILSIEILFLCTEVKLWKWKDMERNIVNRKSVSV